MKQPKKESQSIQEKLETTNQISIKTEDTAQGNSFLVKQEDITPKKEENGFTLKSLEAEQQLNHKKNNSKRKTRRNNHSDDHSPDNDISDEEKNSTPARKGEKGSTSAKNIIKNYGRALQNFAVSNMVLPYITPLLKREKVSLKDFRSYLYPKKKEVRSIAGLRGLLVINTEDNENIASFKTIFRELSIIFIKFFSVNWIYSGKLLNKSAHLKCRFKMLRRIKNPEKFTYLKDFM